VEKRKARQREEGKGWAIFLNNIGVIAKKKKKKNRPNGKRGRWEKNLKSKKEKKGRAPNFKGGSGISQRGGE